ncbi:MAG: ion transporter, partial [Verrucomicrobiota bacterium]
IFIIELLLKLLAYRLLFWRNGWNVFDFLVIGIALVPASGSLSILRTLRVLRVLRLLSIIPSLRKVVMAFLHSIPGLLGVMAVMVIFFYVSSVLATSFFGEAFPEWFGNIGLSLYSLFQIMTLESWSMGIVRPVMKLYPWAWAFFVPFIIIATFTILNLFIGIIVSTMQELSTEQLTKPTSANEPNPAELLNRIESDLADLRIQLNKASLDRVTHQVKSSESKDQT